MLLVALSINLFFTFGEEKNISDLETMSDQWAIWAVIMFWACGSAFFSTVLIALFTDSTPISSRSWYISLLFMNSEFVSFVGPLISLCVNKHRANEDWKRSDAEFVLMSALVVMIVVSIPLTKVDDDKALEDRKIYFRDSVVASRGLSLLRRMQPDERKSVTRRQVEKVTQCKSNKNSMREEHDDDDDELGNSASEIEICHCEGLEDEYKNFLFETQRPFIRRLQRVFCCWDHVSGNAIPMIIVFARLIITTANGFTGAYIQSYFVSEVGVSQTAWDVLRVLTPFIIVAGYFTCAIRAASNARIQVIFSSYIIALISLFVMVLLNGLLDKTYAYISLPLYILHDVFMQRAAPIELSVLMDYSPKAKRGMWFTLYTITAFTQPFMALAADEMISTHGYNLTFFVQGLVQSVGAIVLLVIIPFVPNENELSLDEMMRRISSYGYDGSASEGRNGLDEPLLGGETSSIHLRDLYMS